jgi:hypothetical protein
MYNAGSGFIRGENMKSASAYLRNKGSGDCHVTAGNFLLAEIFANGNVFCYGLPKTETNIKGSGRLYFR